MFAPRASSFLSYGLKNCRAQGEIITFYNLVIILAARITHKRRGWCKRCVCAPYSQAHDFCCCFWRGSRRAPRVCECVSSSLMLSISLQLGSLLYFQWFPQHSHSLNVTCGGSAPKKCVCEAPPVLIFIHFAAAGSDREMRIASNKRAPRAIARSRARHSNGHPFIGPTES